MRGCRLMSGPGSVDRVGEIRLRAQKPFSCNKSWDSAVRNNWLQRRPELTVTHLMICVNYFNAKVARRGAGLVY